jgi:hypothetical protein
MNTNKKILSGTSYAWSIFLSWWDYKTLPSRNIGHDFPGLHKIVKSDWFSIAGFHSDWLMFLDHLVTLQNPIG